MSFMKIGGNTALQQGYSFGLPAGRVAMLPPGQANVGTYSTINWPGWNLPQVTLTGQYLIKLGQYSTLQIYDSTPGYWRNLCSGGPYSEPVLVSADGANYRVANTTGCPVGVLMTNQGSAGVNGFYGYVQFGSQSAPSTATTIISGTATAGNSNFTATPSAGSSTWNLMVGGSVNTTVSLSGTVYQNGAYGGTGTASTGSGGTLYTLPPLVLFFPPPNQGAQPYFLPSAVTTISGGAVNGVTVINQGAGLLGLPGIVFVNAPGDTTGSGAVAGWSSGNSADPNTGKLTAMWPADYGSAVTAVPTFTFAGASAPGSAAATALMNFVVTGFGGSGGVGYGTTPGGIINSGGVAGAATSIPILGRQLVAPLSPNFSVTTGTGVPVLYPDSFQGSGYQAVPIYTAIPNGTAAPSTANTNTVTVGGVSDVVTLIPI
jgi:hypothetical protein